MNAVIRTSGLVKVFGRTRALDGLDLEVGAGEVHGFLGPNGAGKSTTIRVLLGMLRPSAGEAQVFGLDAWRDAVPIHRRVASVPGDVTLWPNLSGGEAIDTMTRLRGGDPRSPERERLIDAFDLDARKKCRSYSKGNRQKVALVAAFLTPADLYVFDEPTSGLDPLMEQVFRDEVERITSTGATVLLSSHILSEVERLCSRVSIIRAGRIVESGAIDDMRHLAHSIVHVHGALPPGMAVTDVTPTEGGATASVAPDHLAGVLAALSRAVESGEITSVTLQPPSLEELFLRHYGREHDAREGRDARIAPTAPGSSGAPRERAHHGRHARAPEGGDGR